MPKTVSDDVEQQEALVGAPLPEGTPSRVEEKDPSIARICGIAGLVFVLAGTVMWYWNAYVNPDNPPFRPTWIRIWWVVGVGGMMFHALRDRDRTTRRSYGLLGYALVVFGLLAVAIHVANKLENPVVTGIVAAVAGLLAVFVTVAPFVRENLGAGDGEREAASGFAAVSEVLKGALGFFLKWWASLKSSNKVQQFTIAAIVGAVLFIIAGYYLLRQDVLPFGVGGLLLGFLFLFAYSTREREDAWRDAAVFVVGLAGILAALAAGGPVFANPYGLSVYGLPLELVLGATALLLLGAFIGMKTSDSPAGHGMAVVLFVLGSAIVVAGLLRSFIPAIQFRPANMVVPMGFLSVVLGGIGAFVGATLAFDNRLLTMTRRELAAAFYSPIAYIVFACMGIMAWWAFIPYMIMLVPTAAGMGGQPIPEPVVAGYYLNWQPIICMIFFLPALTMRLLSEENRSGTLEVLLTAPVNEWLVVLSKFFSAWIVCMLSWAPWLFFPLALRFIGSEEFDTRPIMSFFLGMGLICGGFLSFGLFFSSLTRNQIIAFILGSVAMVVFTFIFFLIRIGEDGGWSQNRLNLLRHVSYINHLIQLIEGKVPLQFLLFHVSLAALGIFLTVKVVEARRWK